MSIKGTTKWYVSEDECNNMEGCLEQDSFEVNKNNSYITEKSTSLEDFDESDGRFADFLPIGKLKLSEDYVINKIEKYDLLMEQQIKIKEENVRNYLENTQDNMDRHQVQKLKANFEKKNLRCHHNIEQFKNKKELYTKRLEQLQGGIPGSMPNSSSSKLSDMIFNKRLSISSCTGIIKTSNPAAAFSRNLSSFYGSARDLISTASNGNGKRSVDKQAGKQHLVVDNLAKLPLSLLTGCKSKSAADLSPRVESKKFVDNGKIEIESKKFVNNGKIEIESKKFVDNGKIEKPLPSPLSPESVLLVNKVDSNNNVYKEFIVAKRKLNECIEVNKHLEYSIKDLQTRLENAKKESKLLSAQQLRRERLQSDMFELIEKQQDEIAYLKKDICNLEEKIGMKIEEKGKEVQEAVEMCQYQLFNLEQTNFVQQLHVFTNDYSDSSGFKQVAIRSVNHLLTFIAAIFLVMATAVSSVRDYQVNSTRLEKLRAILIITGFVGISLLGWRLFADMGRTNSEL